MIVDEPWMAKALCRGKAPNKRKNPHAPDPWFPERGESTNPGKIVCFTCEVRAECEEYRKRTGSTEGMWAGKIQGKKKDG